VKSEKGFTLIEVVISILVLGIVGAAIVGYFQWSFGVFGYVDRKATAESLARTEMEVIKSLSYDEAAASYDPGTAPYPSTYDVTNSVTANVTGTLGMQKITVTVYDTRPNHGEAVVTLEGYKLNR
jgi:prepilin-type N-terminal cleavage/methylation domain-containing protein